MNNNDARRWTLLLAHAAADDERIAAFQRLFRNSAEYAVLLFGTENKGLQERQKKLRGSDKSVNVRMMALPSLDETQAIVILNEAEKVMRTANRNEKESDVWLLLDALPAGLYEGIRACFSASRLREDTLSSAQLPDDNRLFSIRSPRPYLPSKAMPLQSTSAHKKPEKTIGAQDREFLLDLLDEDEQDAIEHALLSSRSVLITGERGTGKTLLAHYIHYHNAATAQGRFVSENLASIPEHLVDSELRGITARTATEVSAREGLLRAADNGTLFLDEIAEANDAIQVKLLHLVSERIVPVQFRRIGAHEDDVAHVRFIAATNVPLPQLAAKLRPDLMSRFPIRIHLKSIYEKRNGFETCLAAMKHFASLDCMDNPLLTPDWDSSTTMLMRLWQERALPGNYRDLHSLITAICDHRQRRPSHEAAVTSEEIRHACEHLSGSTQSTGPTGAPSAIAISQLASAPLLLDMTGDASRYTEEQIKNVVYHLRLAALKLCQWYGSDNQAKARRVYGVPNPHAFGKICRDHRFLHPTTCKRRN